MSRLTLQRITKTPKILTNSTESMELKMIKIERLFCMLKTKMVRIVSSTKDHTRRQTDSAEQMKHRIQYRMKKKSRRFGVVVKPIITLIIFA